MHGVKTRMWRHCHVCVCVCVCVCVFVSVTFLAQERTAWLTPRGITPGGAVLAFSAASAQALRAPLRCWLAVAEPSDRALAARGGSAMADCAAGCRLPAGPDFSESPPRKGEVHRRLWGPMQSWLGADLVVGVGSHASVGLPSAEREGTGFFEAQHNSLQDVDAAHRIFMEHGGSYPLEAEGHDGAPQNADEAQISLARLRAMTGILQDQPPATDRARTREGCPTCTRLPPWRYLLPGGQGRRGVGQVPMQARYAPALLGRVQPTCTAVPREPRTCPRGKKNLRIRSPFGSLCVQEGTVEETIYQEPPRPKGAASGIGANADDSEGTARDRDPGWSRNITGDPAGDAEYDGAEADDNRVVLLAL